MRQTAYAEVRRSELRVRLKNSKNEGDLIGVRPV